MVALATVTLIAAALPLSRSRVSAEEPNTAPVLVVSDGFAATLHSQAQSVVRALTKADRPLPTPQEPAPVAQSLDGFPGAALVPRPVLTAAADVLMQGALAGPDGRQMLAMELQQPVRFTLHEGSFPSVVFSTRPTVGGALTALGADYSRHDIVSPLPDTPLTAGLHVFIQRATQITLSVGGGEPATVYTHVETVEALLAEQGVELSGGDSVAPALDTPLSDGLDVVVTVVGQEVETVDTPIPFQTVYLDDPDLPEGQSAVTQYGVDGYVHREYAVTYQNGEEISRELVNEFTVAPTHQIVIQGTAPVAVAVAVSAPSGDPNCARTLTVWATWYNAASAGDSTTATGTTVRKGTVAVDPRVIPLGTQMYIPGYGYGTAEDTGGAIVGNIIDLGYGPNDVKDWRSHYVDVCILN